MATKRNGKYKYPYIADPDMYKAVMGACSWIRKDGYFNKAVSYYSRYYGVDADELAAEIRKRQAAGQRGKTYSWFVVRYEDGERLFTVKATSRENAESAYSGGYREVVAGPCKSECEAERALEKARKQIIRRRENGIVC